MVLFSAIFVVDTNVIWGYNFVALLTNGENDNIV